MRTSEVMVAVASVPRNVPEVGAVKKDVLAAVKTDLNLLTLDFETFKTVVVDSEETTMDFTEIVRERLAQAWR